MTGEQGRLAFLLPHLRGGGAERVALRLIEDFVAQGYAVDLLVMEMYGELLPLLPPSVRVIDLKAPRIRDVMKPLVRYLRAERPLGIQIFMWPLTVVGVLAHRLARSRARLVLSDHTTLSRQYAHLSPLSARVMRQSISWTYPRADARVIVSRDAARDLAALSGIPLASIDVIYNPIAAPRVEPEAVRAVEESWPAGASRILTVGSLTAAKNHQLLIEAFARLCERRPATLVILGDGPLREASAAQALAAGVADQVRMPGFVGDPAAHYATADLFVLSSDYEGYPLVLVEAMHSGLGIVSTDCESGPREILDNGAYGRLVPCRDPAALAQAMADALDRPVNPVALQQRAEALSGQDTSDRYLRLMTGRPQTAD
jgi:glycosyltransferase involved in cell wall biosynthesis